MRTRRCDHGQVTVIHLAGACRAGADCRRMLATVGQALGEGRRDVVVNCRALETFDTDAVAGLLAVKTLVEAVDGRLVACGLDRPARAVAARVRLAEAVPLAGDVDEALGALRDTPSP